LAGYALLKNRTVWGWGGGTDQELGTGDCSHGAPTGIVCSNRDTPLRVTGLADIVSISVAGARGLAIRG
jgi:hypothetical protein